MTGNRRAALVVCVALTLAGCTMGPDYHLPAAAVVNRPAARGPLNAPIGLTAADDLPPRWWHLYDDPVLDGLEKQALAGSTDLRIAAANLARAEAMTRAAEGAAEPELTVDAAAERAQLSGESYLLSEPLPAATLGSADVQVSYQLDLFGRIRRSVEAARADEEARRALLGAVRVTLAGEVARAYVGVCGAQETVDALEAASAVQQDLLRVARRLQAAGRISETEVPAAQARAAEVEALVPQARARAMAGLYQLAFLLGRVPSDYPRAAEACRHLPQLTRPLPIGDGASLLARRPDVRAAERQLAAATARIGVATAELYPQIGFAASVGSAGYLADLGSAAANSWSIGSLIHWAFPTAGARARVKAAGADQQRALASFDGTVLTALRDAQTALATYGEDHARAISLDRAAEAAQRESDQLARLKRAGRAPAQTELGGRAGALAAQLRAQIGRDAVAQDQVTLFLALGGGW
ncbi:MAG: efflux transporter outer membrane subunit [Sphingomonadales bacterium]|nr:efflux transporter outer membrane subunit [Sphingomonadales bacterium]